MHKKVRFYILFLFGICIYLPFVYMSILVQFYVGTALFSVGFFFYSYLVYRATYLRLKRKYPLISPDGQPDTYFPRTNIPRPIFEDEQRYPEFFEKKKHRKS